MVRQLSIGLLLAGLVGCSTPPDAVFDPDATPVVFFESHNPDTTRTEREYVTVDGNVLGYIAHAGPGGDTVLVYLHGIESHAGWFDEAGDLLAGRGYNVDCLDRRGSGVNRENRGYRSGDIDSYETLFSDIDAFIAPLHDEYDSVYLAGLSWGGKLAMAYSLAHPDRIDGLVLITPGIRAKVDASFGEKIGIVTSSIFNPTASFRTPIQPEMFTPVPHTLQMIIDDPLRLRYATARFFLQSVELDKYVDRHMPENRLPILLFEAGQDQIIDNAGVRKVLKRGAQTDLQIILYDDQTHSIQFDAPDRLVDDIVKWLDQPRQGDSVPAP